MGADHVYIKVLGQDELVPARVIGDNNTVAIVGFDVYLHSSDGFAFYKHGQTWFGAVEIADACRRMTGDLDGKPIHQGKGG